MRDFALNFTHPWLLFLFIPAVIILVVAMLRVPKKYRNTRNRVVSVVLEAIVLACAILVLSGLTFTYSVGNSANEVILLVDVTDSMTDCEDNRDNYVRTLIEYGEDDGCSMGIVTFGFTQVYAVPLTTDYDSIYGRYKSAQLPDTTATDMGAALEYTAKLFTNPQASKIVVISDGKETDESARSSLTYVTSRGTAVESVYIPSKYECDDIQIVGVETPEGHINKGDAFDLTVSIQCNVDSDITVIATDNGAPLAEETYVSTTTDDGSGTAREKLVTVNLNCTLYDKYLHAIRITVGGAAEEFISENNEYYVYIYIDNYNNILIFESIANQSDDLADALNTYGEAEEGDEDAYNISVLTLDGKSTEQDLPLTVDELRKYDLVILDNVSNSDMFDSYLAYIESRDLMGEDGGYYSYFYSVNTGSQKKSSDGGLLPRLLYDYVYTYGGGLLTSGGLDSEGEANTYSRSDMYGSVLQNMLPVTAINYTEPTGVMFVIDTSGSMGTGEDSTLAYAINGAIHALNLLSVRDYVGVMEFSSTGNVVMGLTSLTQASTIQAALNNLLENPQSGGTVLHDTFSSAISTLEASSNLFKRKHIVLVTDGLLSDTDDCKSLCEYCYNAGITVSSIVIGASNNTSGVNNMTKICGWADGEDNVYSDKNNLENSKYIFDCTSDNSQVGSCIYYDLQDVVWEEINYQEQMISIDSSSQFSSLVNDLQYVRTLTDDEGNVLYGDDGLPLTEKDWGHLNASITRFYGTTIKSGATLILTGDYSVPIYAQWSYGAGMVGSYMGDLYKSDTDGYLSILEYDDGAKFIVNIVDNLMPSEDIRPTGIDATLSEDNYTNRVTVYANLEEGYTISGEICDADGNVILNLNEVTNGNTDELDAYVTVAMTESNGYARANFVIKTPGVYTITLTMYDADGREVENDMGTLVTTDIFKEFSYSAEYDNFNAEDGAALMDALSTGIGSAVTDEEGIELIFDSFVTKITKEVDPRLALIIIALVLFLLGIAVRKFKWKWIHEIVRDRRQKKAAGGGM